MPLNLFRIVSFQISNLYHYNISHIMCRVLLINRVIPILSLINVSDSNWYCYLTILQVKITEFFLITFLLIQIHKMNTQNSFNSVVLY